MGRAIEQTPTKPAIDARTADDPVGCDGGVEGFNVAASATCLGVVAGALCRASGRNGLTSGDPSITALAPCCGEDVSAREGAVS
jgi:hypothetical protein